MIHGKKRQRGLSISPFLRTGSDCYNIETSATTRPLEQCSRSLVLTCLSTSWSRRISCPISECATSCIMACRVCPSACPNDTSTSSFLPTSPLPRTAITAPGPLVFSSSLLSSKPIRSTDGGLVYVTPFLFHLCHGDASVRFVYHGRREDGSADRGLRKQTIPSVIRWHGSRRVLQSWAACCFALLSVRFVSPRLASVPFVPHQRFREPRLSFS
ncbi:hypothetical protein BC827DRAFT_818708 [Russula dissimulans]|nr:hypothetical protein BC827DRAFT_818708 [Russula dissimulans]